LLSTIQEWGGSFAHWLTQIPDGDKLGALVNGFSILAAILVAGWLSPKLQDRAAKQDRKERTLRILLNTWQTPANAEYQSALAMTSLDFHDVRKVMLARTEYIAHVNRPAPDNETPEHHEKSLDLQIAIMCAMADELDYDITPESLKSGAYISKGFVDRETLILRAVDSWPHIADGIRQSNLIALGLHPAQQALQPAPRVSRFRAISNQLFRK